MSQISELSAVRDFWNAAPCGSRYLETNDDYESHARARYGLEPFILEFADFPRWRGKRVLEIGVGMGADYVQWLQAGAIATGVDLSSASLERAAHRCELAGVKPDLRLANAEELPFSDGEFDLVYSYGVLHHSPNTLQCLREVRRVLKPGGRAKTHGVPPSFACRIDALGALRSFTGKIREGSRLPSPGEPRYKSLHSGGSVEDDDERRLRLKLSHHASGIQSRRPAFEPRLRPVQSPLYRAAWKLYPRWVARRLGKKRGLFLLMEAA